MTVDELTGCSTLGFDSTSAGGGVFFGINPATGEELQPAYGNATAQDVDQACALAAKVFDEYRETSLDARAAFLEGIAQNILALGKDLVERAVVETGLTTGRIEGERTRTVDQLRFFAGIVREGSWRGVCVQPAAPDRRPTPRPDLRLRHIPLGPVAVFGASNFPLAFSVAGGDTASALAAGCPVIVKAHPSHPGTSELVGRAVARAVSEAGLPVGVFCMLFGAGKELGSALVCHPAIKAVGFTGSRAGGLALVALAAERPEPIPVFAEMSSINPVLLLPGALASRGASLAAEFVASLTLGAGQFCTNPGIVLMMRGEGCEAFIQSATDAVHAAAASPMLSPGIFTAYLAGIERLASTPGVTLLTRGAEASGVNRCQPALFRTDDQTFLSEPACSEEVFGASSLLVVGADIHALRRVLEGMEGQLTMTLQMDAADSGVARALLPLLERTAGRILVNGWPTGVEVSAAMVHGGPFPSTSDGRTTSVGALAIDRFLRPVCYQNFPEALLPTDMTGAHTHGS